MIFYIFRDRQFYLDIIYKNLTDIQVQSILLAKIIIIKILYKNKKIDNYHVV